MEIIMQAKPVHRRHPGRSVKPVAFLALTMAMALISALLIVHPLTQTSEPDPLWGVGSLETETVFLLAHEGGRIDHCSLANSAAAKDQAPSVVLHAIRHIKPRLFVHDRVANPRNSGTIAVVCALS